MLSQNPGGRSPPPPPCGAEWLALGPPRIPRPLLGLAECVASVCQSLSIGQGSFKANLAKLRRHKVESPPIFSVWDQRQLSFLYPQGLRGQRWMERRATDQPDHPPKKKNVTSPLKRGRVLGTQAPDRLRDPCFWWLFQGRGSKRVPFSSPLSFLPEPKEELEATLLT